MPVGFSSAARNLFLLGSSGQQVVTNFFKRIDQSTGTDGVYRPDEIRFNALDEKFLLAGSAQDSNSKEFGWFEKRDNVGTSDWDVRVEATQSGVDTTLRAMELDSNDNLIVVGKTGDVPWIAKYSNGGAIDWQSTTNTADVEYTGITSDSNGNYYACGNTSASFGEATAFVEKFDASGNPGWGKSAFMLGRDVVLNKVAANNRGEVVAVGYLEDDSSDKGYIVKIDTTTGEVLWDRTLDDNSTDPVVCNDVFIDDNDQIYVVGNVGDKGYIVKYTAEGNIIWQKFSANTLDTITYENVKSDSETEQTIVFGTYDDGSNKAGILTKYSKNGDLVWRRILYSSFNFTDTFSNVNLDADPSFYYILFTDEEINELNGTPLSYTFGKVSSSGNGLGNFEYFDGSGETIYYEILGTGDEIGRLTDGSIRNDTSDLITYPFNANKLLFDDLATQVSNKKRQMDSPDSFEYSGSPAIRPADFQELNLLGDVYSGSGNWLDQSGKGNDGVVNGATWNASGWWEFDGNDVINLGNEAILEDGQAFTFESWAWVNTLTNECSLIEFTGNTGLNLMLSAGSTTDGNVGYRFLVRKSGGTEVSLRDGITNNLNEWHHYVGVYNGSDTCKVYVDGIEVDTGTNSSLSGWSYGTVTGQLLGVSSGSRFLDGRIGEVRIYPRALTPAQVFQNYNATKSKYINEAPDIAPKIGPGIVYDSNLLLNYDFGNRATYDSNIRSYNLITASEDFDASDWGKSGISITANTTIGPNGKLTPELMTNTSNESGMSQATNISGGTYTISVYVKYAGTTNWFRMVSGSGAPQAWFDINNGTVGTQLNGATGSIENIGNGWYRCSITANFLSQINVGFIPTSGNGATLEGTGNSVYIWGAQLVAGSEVTEYIKTYPRPTTVKNLSSTSHTGTLIGGATFNSAGYITTPTSGSYINTNYTPPNLSEFTAELWVSFDSFTGTQYVLDCSDGGVNGLTIRVIEDPFDNTEHVFTVALNGSGATLINSPLTTGEVYHLLVKRDTLLRWYIQGGGTFMGGVGEGGNVGGTTNLNTTDPFILGYPSAVSPNQPIDVNIHEFRFYDRSLSEAEISQNFNATRSKYGV